MAINGKYILLLLPSNSLKPMSQLFAIIVKIYFYRHQKQKAINHIKPNGYFKTKYKPKSLPPDL